MTTDEAVDILCNDPDWSAFCDEMHWGGGYSNEAALRFADLRLQPHSLELEDELYHAYQCTEKGLS